MEERVMKIYLQRTLIALMVCTLAAMTAFADKVRKEHVTFASDVMVNGTLVKAGNYELKFDEQTGELAILKDGKVKATTSARLEARSDKARNTEIRTRTVGDMAQLVGVTFGGAREDLVVTSGGGTVTGSDQ
jgi:hypothetical protein